MPQLINRADASGTYQTVTVTDTTQAVVELSAIQLDKEADRPIWYDDSELEYTITAKNLDGATPGDPVENLVITDTIDPAIAQYVTGSVTVDIGGVPVTDPTVTYNATTGLLTVSVGTVPAGETATLRFRVSKR